MTTPEQPEVPEPERSKRSGGKRQPKASAADPMAMLAKILDKANLEHVAETDDEKLSRLSIAEKDAEHERAEQAKAQDHRRRVEMVCLCAVLIITAVVCPVCLWVLASDARSVEQKAWAGPLLTLIIGGLLGFLTGRVPGRPPER